MADAFVRDGYVIIPAESRPDLDRIRDLFETCVSPESSEEWIAKLSSEVPKKPPFKEVLETIWELQQNKAQTIADVLGEEGFARSLSKIDLEYLFSED